MRFALSPFNTTTLKSFQGRRRLDQLRIPSDDNWTLRVCVDCFFSRSPGQAPDGARSACAKRAAYLDPPPVVTVSQLLSPVPRVFFFSRCGVRAAGAALDPPLWTVVPNKSLSFFLSLSLSLSLSAETRHGGHCLPIDRVLAYIIVPPE